MAMLLAGIAGPAAAHPNAGEIDIGLFGGYHIFGSTSSLGAQTGQIANNIDDSPIIGLRVGYFIFSRLAVEVEAAGLLAQPRNRFDDDFLAYSYRANLLLRFTPDLLGGDLFLLGGIGGYTVPDVSDVLTSATEFLPHFGLAAMVPLAGPIGIRFDGRAIIAKNTEDDMDLNYEGLISLYLMIGHRPHEATPAAPVDGDGDGINDDVDRCPTEAEDMDGFQDEDGCPDGDNDGDGVPDVSDKCPTEAGVAPEGCPDTDADGDGIMGSVDRCPNEAEDKDGFQDEDGCPDPDNDGDGVADANDKCPDQLETKNGFEDDDGCADEVPAAVQKFTGTIRGINFVSGSARITRSSFRTLDQAVAVLKEYPSVSLEIAGHTDDVGDAEKNKALSQARADSVKAYLVSKGIEETRLTAVGYGEDKPVDPATTRAARAKNRRVEFQIRTQ
jgi:OOP family OmpA-OmpF porin